MREEEWKAWKDHHCDLFGLSAPTDRGMVEAWRAAFAAEGFTVGELKSATLTMAQDPPKTRMENLAAIQGHIRGTRRARIAAELQAQNTHPIAPTCPICRSQSGGLMVPHPHSIKDGKWIHPYYELWVYCSCARGAKIQQNHIDSYENLDSKRKAATTREKCVGMSLVTYQDKFPDWRELVNQKNELQRAEMLARRATEQVDQTFGNALRQVMNQVDPKQMPAPEFEDEQKPEGEVPF